MIRYPQGETEARGCPDVGPTDPYGESMTPNGDSIVRMGKPRHRIGPMGSHCSL